MSPEEQEEAMQQLRDAIRQLYDARQRQVKAKAAEKQILEAPVFEAAKGWEPGPLKWPFLDQWNVMLEKLPG